MRVIQQTIRGAALCAALCGGLVLSGCGGSGEKAAQPTPPPVSEGRGGALRIVVHWPQAPSRLIPSATQYIRIQVLDTGPNGDAVPLSLTPDDPRSFDLVIPEDKRFTSDDQGNRVAEVQYDGLPIKNLLVRVEAFAKDPVANDPAILSRENPPLSRADRSFVPVPVRPGQKLPSVDIVLGNAITSMVIQGDAEAIINGAPARLRAVGLVNQIPATISTLDLEWEATMVNEPAGAALPPPVKEPGTNTVLVQGDVNRLTAGQALVTARYRLRNTGEVLQTATFLVRLVLAPSVVAANVTGPPAGTRSVRVSILDLDSPGQPRLNTLTTAWQTGSEVNLEFTVPAGHRRLVAEAYSSPLANLNNDVPGDDGPVLGQLSLVDAVADETPGDIPVPISGGTDFVVRSSTRVTVGLAPINRDGSNIDHLTLHTDPSWNGIAPFPMLTGGTRQPLHVYAVLKGGGPPWRLDASGLDYPAFSFGVSNVSPPPGTPIVVEPVRLGGVQTGADLVLPDLAAETTLHLSAADTRDNTKSATQTVTARPNKSAQVDFIVQ